MSKNSKNKKKEKKIYIDDGSTIADMSVLDNASLNKRSSHTSGRSVRPRFKECFRTYIEAVKMMIKPMFITIGIIALAFLIIYLIL